MLSWAVGVDGVRGRSWEFFLDSSEILVALVLVILLVLLQDTFELFRWVLWFRLRFGSWLRVLFVFFWREFSLNTSASASTSTLTFLFWWALGKRLFKSVEQNVQLLCLVIFWNFWRWSKLHKPCCGEHLSLLLAYGLPDTWPLEWHKVLTLIESHRRLLYRLCITHRSDMHLAL